MSGNKLLEDELVAEPEDGGVPDVTRMRRSFLNRDQLFSE